MLLHRDICIQSAGEVAEKRLRFTLPPVGPTLRRSLGAGIENLLAVLPLSHSVSASESSIKTHYDRSIPMLLLHLVASIHIMHMVYLNLVLLNRLSNLLAPLALHID